jgi:hypothetical protein
VQKKSELKLLREIKRQDAFEPDEDISPTAFFSRNLGTDVKPEKKLAGSMAERVGTFDGIQQQPLLSRGTDHHKTPQKTQASRRETVDEFSMALDYPLERRTQSNTKPSREEQKAAKELEKRKKEFNDVKKLRDISIQSKEFGKYVDSRTSDPITLGKTQKEELSPGKLERKSTLKQDTLMKLKEDQFMANLKQSESSHKQSFGVKDTEGSIDRSSFEKKSVLDKDQMVFSPYQPVSTPEQLRKVQDHDLS